MEQLHRVLKPLANRYIIILAWLLTILNFYLYFKPLFEYATAANLKSTPIVLDMLTYYTPDEGYQTLAVLGDQGRDAFRLANYVDFVLPIPLFLALSLPNLAMGKDSRYIIGPLAYMISDYVENIAAKYVLELYPERNDFVMTLACYAGLLKLATSAGSALILIINGLIWISQPNDRLKRKIK